MKMKNNYCKCFYEDGYFFIILNEYLTNLSKIVFEVGRFNEDKKFILMYLMIFNSVKDYKSNFEIMKDIGTKNYFDSLIFNDQNIIALEDNNAGNIGGYIYRYYQKSKDDNLID